MPKQKETTKEKKQDKKPIKVKLSEKDFDSKVLELAKKGMTSEKIGETLRKQGIHPKEHKKISKVLKENNLYQIPDLKNAEAKLERLTSHREKNMQDKRAMREREKIISLLRKHKQYHKLI